MGPHSRHTAQEGDAFCLLEMNVLWCEKCNQSQNNSKGPCEDAGGNSYKSIYFHSKTSPISTAGGTGALHNIDGILRDENDVGILKQHFKRSVRKLKLGRKWGFQMDNDPKHTSKVVAKWP